ncbi:unnamed protein product [Arabidopsis halleri]
MNKNLRYDVAMSSIIIILNIAATFCICWFKAIENVLASKAYFVGRICHTLGFCVFLDLLYSISPHLALYFGLPCLLARLRSRHDCTRLSVSMERPMQQSARITRLVEACE